MRPATFSAGIRYGIGGATIVVIALYALQLFWDRRNLAGFFLLRQHYVATHRVFRMCGFLLSAAHLAALCDSYGVFGVYSAATRVTFRVFMMVIIVPPLCAYFYFSIKPLHPFLLYVHASPILNFNLHRPYKLTRCGL